MTTLHIADNSPAAIKFLEFARTLPFVTEDTFDRIPGVPASLAELGDQLRRVEAEHNPAACIPHAQVVANLEKQIAGLR